MQIKKVAKNSIIELQLIYQNHTMTLRSKVAYIKDNTVFISPIKVNNCTIGFGDQCQVNFLYLAADNLYIWENIHPRLLKVGKNIYHAFTVYDEGRPYNRRNSYRLYIGKDTPVYINTTSGPAALLVLLQDISGTGVAFAAKEELKINQLFRLKLWDKRQSFHIFGKIVRKEYHEELNAFLYGCKFYLNHSYIPKYIAHKQEERLRKTLKHAKDL